MEGVEAAQTFGGLGLQVLAELRGGDLHGQI
jgi:hypothetical protein